MKSLVLLFLLWVPVAWSADISQRTDGPCSPTVADVKGNVSIVCNGIDSSKSDEIIKILNEILRDTKKLDQIKRDLDKTSKRTDAIEARQAPRRLSQNERGTLVKLLAGKSDGNLVNLGAQANNSEAMQFAMDIGYALLAAGWNVDGVGSVTILGLNPIGVLTWIDGDTPSPPTQALIEAFRTVGYEITVRKRTKKPPEGKEKVISLHIGSKPF